MFTINDLLTTTEAAVPGEVVHTPVVVRFHAGKSVNIDCQIYAMGVELADGGKCTLVLDVVMP